MINGINDTESSPASGERVIKYMHDRKLYPCDKCESLHPACLPCEPKEPS